jgi:hypothetical protein
MTLKKISLVFLATLLAVAAAGPAAARQKPASADKILGAWLLEVDAGGEYYYLTMELKLKDGKLDGLLGEQNGMFANVPLTEIEWDGATLKFMAKTPTPPDGAERPLKTELKLAEGKLDGTITIVEMGMTAPVKGTKK